MGDQFLSSAGAGRSCALSMRLANCSPVLDKYLARMGPDILSNTGAGVWRKAPGALPDSSSLPDKFQLPFHSNAPSYLVPSRFFIPFSKGEGPSLVQPLCTPWEALHSKNLAMPTCLRGSYQVRFFGLISGHSWGIGGGTRVVPGMVPLRNLKGRALAGINGH